MNHDTACHVFDTYAARLTAGDVEGVLALYAQHASLTDPAGSPARTSRNQIREAYRTATASKLTMTRTGPVRAATDTAAAPIRITIPRDDDQDVTIDVIDVFTFDQNGLITAMTAYWGPGNVQPPDAALPGM